MGDFCDGSSGGLEVTTVADRDVRKGAWEVVVFGYDIEWGAGFEDLTDRACVAAAAEGG